VIRNSGDWLVPVLVATAGNTFGACTTYWLARAAVAVAPPRSERTRRASALLGKYGAPAMLLSWVPLMGDVLVLLAGAARMPVWRFIGWTTLGKGSRYVMGGSPLSDSEMRRLLLCTLIDSSSTGYPGNTRRWAARDRWVGR
jgi:membrane protein YqaA with SNARE-associated domain